MEFKIFSLDFEHSKILENLPIFFLMGVLLVAFIPVIPTNIKSPIVLLGLIGAIPFMFVIDAVAQVQSAQFMPLKARIKPWNKEITFFCRRPIGQIASDFDSTRGLYKTSFELGVKANLPTIGIISKIDIWNRTPWGKRNLGSEAYIMFRGIEVKHPQVMQVELWFEPPVRVDKLEKIPQFRLMSGSEDYWLLKGKLPEDVISVINKNGNKAICGHCSEELQVSNKSIIMCDFCGRTNKVIYT